jgi:hypothetical protein
MGGDTLEIPCGELEADCGGRAADKGPLKDVERFNSELDVGMLISLNDASDCAAVFVLETALAEGLDVMGERVEVVVVVDRVNCCASHGPNRERLFKHS